MKLLKLVNASDFKRIFWIYYVGFNVLLITLLVTFLNDVLFIQRWGMVICFGYYLFSSVLLFNIIKKNLVNESRKTKIVLSDLLVLLLFLVGIAYFCYSFTFFVATYSV